jgi:hypothetical protein
MSLGLDGVLVMPVVFIVMFRKQLLQWFQQ